MQSARGLNRNDRIRHLKENNHVYFYIIPPIFILVHLILFFIWNLWLKNAFESYRVNKRWRRILLAVILLGAAVPLLGCFLPESGFQASLAAAGNIWLGFFFYLGGISLLLAIFVSLPIYLYRATAAGTYRWARIKKLVSGKGRLVHRGLVIGTLAVAVVINVYGWFHAVDIKVNELPVSIDKPLVIDGEKKDSLKIVLVGDLHMSVNSSPETIQRMVDLINEQDADLVMGAGDFLTSTYKGLKDPETYARILRGIRSKYGSYAVYGNHDVEEPLLGGFPMTGIEKAYRSDELVSFINSLGFQVLADEVTDAADGGIVLVCREDGEKTGDGLRKRLEASELMKGIDQTRPVIVMEHEPVDFDNLEEAGADLVLSGHTHAGQLFPGTLLTQFFNENNYGLKQFGALQSVVTSGIGFYGPPLRVGCDCEVMVLDVHFTG